MPAKSDTGTGLSQFRHKNTQGARLPGWPELNCEKLATAMECSPMHLRGVLAGRLGTTLRFIERVAGLTGLTAGTIVERIGAARSHDRIREEVAADRWQQRQLARKTRNA